MFDYDNFSIEINLGNEALSGENLYPELSRMLKLIAKKLDQGEIPYKLMDINGNCVGTVELN